jgi:hypothetical protein
MDRDPREARNAIGTWQHQDHSRWAAGNVGQDSGATPQVSGQGPLGLINGSRRWIDWRPRPESAVDHLDHRSRVLRRRDRNHKIRNRDAH